MVSLIDWSPDEDFPVFPQGSRPKKTVIAPTVGLPDFLVPGHRYIFKYSVGRHPVQFWSEVIAYELGKLVGVVVPPAFVAIDGDGKPGALIEFFYGHPGSGTNLRYVHAKDYLTRLIPGFDEKKGREHNLMTNMRLCLFFEGKGALRGSIIFWAKTLVFDALIGNTDRHQENWGFLWP
ncbi:MAG: hypothetical protein HQL39_01400, partial [Alphaproteobacteria bacterium]|nr:hypothetical protein [Alphaproteobacteria bacterium]